MTKAAPKAWQAGEFDQLIADEICERVATTARGLDFICESDDALPSARTIHRWLSANAAFCQSYLRARERQADLIFDECLEIADDCSNDRKLVGREGEEYEVANGEFIQRSKVRIDTRLRMAGKLAPKKYGDAVNLKHSSPDGGPVQFEAHADQLASLPAEQRAQVRAAIAGVLEGKGS